MSTIKTIKVLSTPPPQWILDAVKKQFNVDWNSDVVFSYAGNIHTIGGIIPEDIYVHEMVHANQQANFGDSRGLQRKANEWWEEYLIVPAFRFGEEAKAYQKQIEWVKQNHMNKFLKVLDQSAKSLSGPIYGDLMSYEKAREIILDNK